MFQNPVHNANAADPTVVRGADGTFHAFVTNAHSARDGVYRRTPMLTSRDLVHWTEGGDALAVRPAWIAEGPDTVWAPHAVRASVDGRDEFRLYFSGRRADTGSWGIGLAVADRPEGPYRADPEPIISGPTFEVIDPFVFTDADGRSYLYWGSAHKPIKGAELGADGRTLLGEPREVLQPSEAFGGHARLVEAFWVTRKGDKYVGTFSGDNTHNAHYSVMSAVSDSPLGPFTYQGDTPVVASTERFPGPGHSAIVTDDAGADWLLYHAYDGADRSKRVLMLDKIDWEGTLPTLNSGNGPSADPRPAPFIDARRGAALPSANTVPR